MSSEDAPPALQMKATNVSTGFSNAYYDPATGNAGYNLTKPLTDMRNQFYGAATGAAPTQAYRDFTSQVGNYGQGLFGRATQYDNTQNATDYYNKIQGIQAPNRAVENSQLADSLFKTGRSGYASGYTGAAGTGYLNPEQFALLSAREQQNSALATDSYDRARGIQQQDMQTGLGLQNTSNSLAMQPYANQNALFGYGTGIEQLGQRDLSSAGQFGQMQMSWQQAKQQNDAAIQAAENSGGFGGAFGSIAGGAIGSFFGGPLGAQIGSSLGGQLGGGGAGSNIGSSIWGGSGAGSLFGGFSGFGSSAVSPAYSLAPAVAQGPGIQLGRWS